MAVETVTIACPECEHKVKVRAEVVGKKIRCKECEHVFVARPVADKEAVSKKPAAKKPAARAEPARKPAAKGAAAKTKGKEEAAVKPAAPAPKPVTDEDDGNPYGLTDADLAYRCPSCANEMESEDAIICLHCGYNTHTRTAVKTRKIHDTTSGDVFLWLLPGILCVVGILIWIATDLVYCLKIDDWLDPDSWTFFFAHPGIKLWLVITSLFFCYYLGKFAIKRLIINNKPPEVEKS
jgi:DNA-directed RNA polymerase subunit RPC12/RpoP